MKELKSVTVENLKTGEVSEAIIDSNGLKADFRIKGESVDHRLYRIVKKEEDALCTNCRFLAGEFCEFIGFGKEDKVPLDGWCGYWKEQKKSRIVHSYRLRH